VSAKTGVPQERVKALLDRYGTRAEAVAAFIAAGDDQVLQHHSGYSRRELQFLAANERVAHLDDMLLRRTWISFLGGTKRELLEEIAAAVAPTLGWSAAQVTEEVDRALRILHERHGV
ncbi:MAG: FAD-dependent oxidoreductase, partial [Burkholderiales bacterium]|nr:FAD-dependent oxidoreductase [Anaerolineae bacterium]